MSVDKLFLSVGAMKAGTTFLYDAFKNHPEIYFTPEKELHYFAHVMGLSTSLQKPLYYPMGKWLCRDRIRRRSILTNDFRRHRLAASLRNRFSAIGDADRLRSIVQWYADRYLTDPVDETWFDRAFEGVGDRYAADFSNYNALLSDQGWDYVKSMCKQLRVLYVIRNPVDRFWSHVKFQMIHSGRRSELPCFSGKDVRDFLKLSHIAAHARYGDIVQSLKRNLSSEQLKIIFFEQFIDDFPRSAREIEAFLGVSPGDYSGVDPREKRNATESIHMNEDVSGIIQEIVSPQLEKLSSLGVAVPDAYRV